MNDHNDNAMGGALTGIVLSAATAWARYDDDTQRRLRNNREDVRELGTEVRDLQSRGEAIRSRLPVVQDVQVGFAVANAAEPSPSPVPSAAPAVRPDLAMNMESSVSDLHYPPQPGTYDKRGMVVKAGEMTALALALTYEEVRAFILGLVQSKAPNSEGKRQIYLAANALTRVVQSLKLTSLDYQVAWDRLFGGGGLPGGGSTPTTHNNPQTPPQIQFVDPGLTVKPLGMPELPLPYKHNNTDAASKWRIAVGGNAVNSGSVVATFTFGQTYMKGGELYVPIVTVNDPRFIVQNVTPQGFQVSNYVQLPANSVFDIFVSASSGCC